MNKPLKPLLLIGNNVSPETADALRKSDQFEVITASIGEFPSGGLYVELFRGEEKLHEENLEKLKGRRAYVLQSAPESNPKAFEHLKAMAHTMKWYGVSKVTAIAPFLPNLRQDRSLKDRFTSVAADRNAKELQAVGVDGVITLTAHSKASVSLYQKVFGDNFVSISATEMFAKHIESRYDTSPEELSIGAPDGADKPSDEGQARARELAKEVFGAASSAVMFRISKIHTGVSDTKITSFDGDVAGKDVIIVDDMIDGGSTMLNAANLLKAHGARTVSIYATHALLTGNALENLLSAKPDGMTSAIDKIIITDTMPDAREKLNALLAQQPKYAGRVEIMSAGPAILEKVTELELKAAKPFLEGYTRPNAPSFPQM